MRTLVLALLLPICAYSQQGEGSPSVYNEWKNKTLVIITYPDNKMVNATLKEVAEERWQGKKIETVAYADTKTLKGRKDIVILKLGYYTSYGMPIISISTDLKSELFTNSSDGWAYATIPKIAGLDTKAEKKLLYKKIKNNPVIDGLVNLRHASAEKIKLITNSLFNTTDKFKAGEYEFKFARKSHTTFTKQQLDILKSKTLLISKNSFLKGVKEEDIKSNYTGKLKFVTEDQLKNHIAENSKTTVYLSIAWEASVMVYSIIDLETSEVIYSNVQQPKAGNTYNGVFINMVKNLSDITQ